MTFTKERLLKIPSWSETYGPGSNVVLPAEEAEELARIALASTVEPVYQYRIRNGYNGQVTEWQTIRRDQVDFVLKAQPLNAEFQIIAPPAPVVPDEATPQSIEILASTYAPCGVTYQWDKDECNAAADSWNACRAAMLQGAEPTKAGLTLREGLAAIRNSGIAIDAEKIQAQRDSLNSPVIPNGWVMVPVEPTKEMIDAGWSYYMTTKAPSSTGVYGAMLAAAPQQEV